MSREDDYKILCWVKPEIVGQLCPQFIPKYSEYDSDAIALLPVLVERGYRWLLLNKSETGIEIKCKIYSMPGWVFVLDATATTIAAAITAAVLALIDREGKP